MSKLKAKSTQIFGNFSLYIFACIFCSSAISTVVTYLSLYYGVFNFTGISILIRVLIVIASCLLFGTLISILIGKKSNNYVGDIANAIKEVAHGNFNYELKVSDKLIFKDVATSFNIMAKQLASTEILRQDFIANFSHEFRTPINSICGYAELLKTENVAEEDKREYVDVIINESKRLFRLADSILYLSNLKSTSKLPVLSYYRLDEQIRQVLLMFEKKWKERNINLELDLDSITIAAREEFLHHIWSNLISNALKFTRDEVRISLHKQDSFVVFTIADNGVGMTENVKNHAFDMFYQADVSHNSGSGLGLSIVKRIVDICNYDLSVESDPYSGATFTLKIPFRK